MNNTFNSLFVHDHQSMQPSPVRHQWRGRGNSSPRFNGPRPRGSPYQWTPNKHNNSWSSDVIIYTFKIDIMYGNCITYFFQQHNNSGSNKSYEQNTFYRPQQNIYKKQNFNVSFNLSIIYLNYFHDDIFIKLEACC